MRIFLCTLLGIPLLLADGLLLYSLPLWVGASSRDEGWIVAGGAAAYLAVHFLVRKPERLYLWGHEFSHLVAAKLFLRKVHGFHISSRAGGKVVIDRTNVLIDLAPYAVPFYVVVAAAAAAAFRTVSPWIPDLYLALAGFFFTMHLVFSAEGFLKGQPDLKRSGRIFSAAVVALVLILLIPCLLAPGTPGGWRGALETYRAWAPAARDASRALLSGFRGLLKV